MKKFIIVGQIPPPSHGQSIMIQNMINGLENKLDIEVVEMRFSNRVDENGDFSLRKIFHLFQLISKLNILLKKYPDSILYYPASPPKWSTFLRDWIILLNVRKNAKKLIFHFHAYGLGEFLFNRSYKKIFRKPFLYPDLSIVLNESCLADANLLLSKKTSIIPYGIDVPFIENDVLPFISTRIIFVGLHIESKGILNVLKVANILKDKGLSFTIHTIGPWKNKEVQEQYQNLIMSYGLEDFVNYKGELVGKNLWNEYKSADILFFPTYFEFETFGLVVLEAMAHKLAVVCSNWRGPSSIVKHDSTGYICDTHNITVFSNALETLIKDRALCIKMGEEGFKLYKEKYHLEVYIHNMYSAFKELSLSDE